MHIVELEQGSPEWHEFRKGKITGTRLGSIWSSRAYNKEDIVALLEGRNVEFKKSDSKAKLEELLTEEDKEYLSMGGEKKLEYYQILADQVAVSREDSEGQYGNMMDRGLALEDVAAKLFAEKFGKDLRIVGCIEAEADPRIINSPDRLIKPKKGRKITEAVEVKCLASAKHLMAFFERKVPEEYWTQKVQYFVTNEQLQTLYWVFYDPDIPMLPMFCLIIEREDLGHWPQTMLKYQLRTLKELDALTIRLFEESDNIMLRAQPEKGVTA